MTLISLLAVYLRIESELRVIVLPVDGLPVLPVIDVCISMSLSVSRTGSIVFRIRDSQPIHQWFIMKDMALCMEFLTLYTLVIHCLIVAGEVV